MVRIQKRGAPSKIGLFTWVIISSALVISVRNLAAEADTLNSYYAEWKR